MRGEASDWASRSGEREGGPPRTRSLDEVMWHISPEHAPPGPRAPYASGLIQPGTRSLTKDLRRDEVWQRVPQGR